MAPNYGSVLIYLFYWPKCAGVAYLHVALNRRYGFCRAGLRLYHHRYRTFLNPQIIVNLFPQIGGGTAGLAVAARLSENPDVTVGVVEAGKYRIGDPQVDCPAAFLGMFEDPEYDWCLYSEPQVSRCHESSLPG